MRGLAIFFVALLACVLPHLSHATTRQDAHAQCAAYYAANGQAQCLSAHQNYDFHAGHCEDNYPPTATSGFVNEGVQCKNRDTGQLSGWLNNLKSFQFNEPCPAGTEWNPVTKKCDPPCSERPAINNKAVRGASTFCSEGCQYKPKDNHGDQDPNALNLCMQGISYCAAAAWVPTGQACAVEDPQEAFDPKKETCAQLANGYGECVKPDGTHCATASTGKQLCWKPGETGPRSTSDGLFGGDRQKAPGVPSPPSNLQNPQQEANSGTTINNTYYNSSSYSAGGTNGQPGQPNTGVDGDGDGDGEDDDGDEGSASGGAGCASPPVCSGDAVMCAVLDQQWRARCGETKGDGNGDGQPDWTEGDKPQGEDPGEDVGPTRFGLGFSTDLLDTEDMFGSGSCPSLSLSTQFISFASGDLPQWCTIVDIMRAVVLVFGAFTALQILMGRM